MKQKTQNEFIEFAEIDYDEMLDKTQEAEKYLLISDGWENTVNILLEIIIKNLEFFSLSKQKYLFSYALFIPPYVSLNAMLNIQFWGIKYHIY